MSFEEGHARYADEKEEEEPFDTRTYTLNEKIGHIYWKIFDQYKNKGFERKEAGKIAKIVCIRIFGYQNYMAWKYRAR